MKSKTGIEFEEGSGNVFADLGLENAEELLARAQIGVHVVKLIKDRGLKQKEASMLLGIAQPDVSRLLNGHFNRFTADKLLEFIRLLEYKVMIQISPHKKGEPFQQVAVEM